MRKVALITGITGQDGSYLAELLLEKDYEVHGIVASGDAPQDLGAATIHYADLADGRNLGETIAQVEPDELYNLAAQSKVSRSFQHPLESANVTGLGALRVLEAVRGYQASSGRMVRFYQASSSEMFGGVAESPQNEQTPFHPRSPYACAKLFAYWQTINYREAFGLFACNGILFNHESPRRDSHYVTRKITRAAARIKLGLADRLVLGNLDVRRDWGFAGDYVDAMWRMLQQDEPDDYVVATGETHSVREFVSEAFAHFDLDWTKSVETDADLYRPAEVEEVCGDAAKARRVLGWEPNVSFKELVDMMTQHDLRLAQEEKRTAASHGESSKGRP